MQGRGQWESSSLVQALSAGSFKPKVKLTTSLFAFYYDHKPGILHRVSGQHPPCRSSLKVSGLCPEDSREPCQAQQGSAPTCIAFTFLSCRVPNP